MSDYLAWMQATQPTAAQRIAKRKARAVHTLRRLADKEEPPTSVTFKTAAGTVLAAQTVRLEVDNRSSVISSAAGAAPRMQLIVYGVRQHATLADTDMKEGYRFVYLGDEYRIDNIILQLGEIQGVAVATG